MTTYANAPTQARRVGNLVKHQALKQVRLRRGASRASKSAFDDLLDRHAVGHDQVFVHAGLGDVRDAFDVDPYRFLLGRLAERFESVVAPGFTDYFTVSGVYHKQFSRPKHGAFVRQFHEDADYRTDDAIKSFLVKGPYRFDDCVHRDTYHEEGCFARLVRDEALLMNVGTPWFTCSHLHYLEAKHDVPYVETRTHEGVIYRTPTEHERIEQTYETLRSPLYSWNKPKIMRRLRRAGALNTYDLNGLNVYVSRLDKVERVLGAELRDDPYYLVTL
ncbi:AAC(3) family N-acetyltransferase [Halogeometricum sp. S1BR25-6]|uniref:AAC(3) family N-acetyltransferase n=1 Tax=Halogeometricum salsisoli TaxID=2950536 RepID=A0ABU2GHU6_9EURY|nr:AAC(3) family N-acetyltransferase [Halogeometricum sp. S1BR25-6]MDS0300405.1 AAC(3) family N-acetyltransferase [Halogeometricum sp. S1BR25-6]